jgi:hypothetical protein
VFFTSPQRIIEIIDCRIENQKWVCFLRLRP